MNINKNSLEILLKNINGYLDVTDVKIIENLSDDAAAIRKINKLLDNDDNRFKQINTLKYIEKIFSKEIFDAFMILSGLSELPNKDTSEDEFYTATDIMNVYGICKNNAYSLMQECPDCLQIGNLLRVPKKSFEKLVSDKTNLSKISKNSKIFKVDYTLEKAA
ncbi:MAG: hypothetical protein ACI4XC_04465 [Eubacterium sp.]